MQGGLERPGTTIAHRVAANVGTGAALLPEGWSILANSAEYQNGNLMPVRLRDDRPQRVRYLRIVVQERIGSDEQIVAAIPRVVLMEDTADNRSPLTLNVPETVNTEKVYVWGHAIPGSEVTLAAGSGAAVA